MLRGIFATVTAVVLATLVVATTASAAPPGITFARCQVPGSTSLTFKGHPNKVQFEWEYTTQSGGTSTTGKAFGPNEYVRGSKGEKSVSAATIFNAFSFTGTAYYAHSQSSVTLLCPGLYNG